MEGNKDEAQKCFRIGKDALEGGDPARALRFLSKARRLDPTLPVDDLLSKINGVGSDDHPIASDSGSHAGGRYPDGTGRSDIGSSTSSSSAAAPKARDSPDGSSREYTEEQVSVIRQIKKQKDYYQILGLERNCTVEDVRKAYRKLSLKVHPDKNKAPGAEDAFKAVSKAFQCLGNEESRKLYDISETEEPTYSRNAPRRDMHGFGGYYEADIDPDEIFRNFFFGGMPQATTPFGTFRFRTGGMGGPVHHDMQGSGSFNIRTLIQILPVILLLLLNFLPSSDPLYVLSRAYPHEHRLETQRGVPYFVKPGKFEEEYPYQSAKRMALEERIEREYVGVVSHNCRLELQRRQWGFINKTPHCDMLQRFEAAATATAEA
uniref:Chaperone protein dnaJ 49 n=2 Tax=Anthurium amnicola TaxID=1678845 RepID=A0A1D1XTJ7_9ARAE